MKILVVVDLILLYIANINCSVNNENNYLQPFENLEYNNYYFNDVFGVNEDVNNENEGHSILLQSSNINNIMIFINSTGSLNSFIFFRCFNCIF